MTIATTNRAVLRIVPESAFNTTPATPPFQNLRYTGESLNCNIAYAKSAQIRADRNIADTMPVGLDAGGDINFEFSKTHFDSYLEALFCGTWSANVLKNGVTNRSFTIQRHIQDSTAAVFMNFTGARFNTMELNIQQGAIMTGKFGIMAADMSTSASQIAGAVITAEPTDTPMTAVANVTSIEDAGVASTDYFSKLTLNITNNMRGLKAVGGLGNVAINAGTFEVTGSMDMYFQSKTMLDRYRAGTAFSLSWTLVDGSSSYDFLLPNVKFESGQVMAGGNDQDIMYSGNIRALYNAADACTILITRVP